VSSPVSGTPTAPRSTSSSGATSGSDGASTSPDASTSGSTTPGSGTSTSPGTLPTLQVAQQTPLVVLNNSTISGLAAGAALRFEDAGWTVSSYGNLTNDIISTCAYYDPSDPAARPAARVLRHEFPTIKRVKRKFPQLPAGPVVVVLTSDYVPG
jgi:hypothetical protein